MVQIKVVDHTKLLLVSITLMALALHAKAKAAKLRNAFTNAKEATPLHTKKTNITARHHTQSRTTSITFVKKS